MQDSRGFALMGTLLMIVAGALVLTIIAIPQYIQAASTQERDTLLLIDRVVHAIRGDGETTFGYLGDMGVLPPTLSALVTSQTPAFTQSTTKLKVGMGWNGPYLLEEGFAGDQLKDGWGQSFVYSTTSSGGVLQTAVIRSMGPDGVASTSDDLVSETIHARGSLKLYVWKDQQKTIDQPTVVKAFYSNNGAEASINGTRVTGGSEDHMLFTSLHAGVHAVQLLKDGQYERMVATIRIHGGVENSIKLGYTD